jgi:hypothetical protein
LFNADTAPSDLVCDQITHQRIICAWTDNADDEDGFEIDRCTGTGCSDYALIGTVGAGVTSFSDLGLVQATTYRYRVRAFNAGGNSSYATAVEATTLTAPRLVRFRGIQ